MDFHGNINLKDNEMQKLIFQQESSFPVDSVTGSVVFKGNVLYMSVAVGNDSQPVWIPLTASIDTYVHTQTSAATTWTISHALGDKFPLVQVYDDNHFMIIPDSIVPDNTTTLAITFSTAVSGVAVVIHGDEIPANGIGIIEPSIDWIVNVSNMTFDNVESTNLALAGASQNAPTGLRFNSDGTKLFVVGLSSGVIAQYSLSVAYDASTLSYDGIQFSVTAQGLSPNGLAFNNDGTKIYVVSNNNGSINEYNLPTPYILTGMSYSGATRTIVGAQTTNATGITFNNNGTKMYRCTESDIIEQYTLTIGFDLSTATFDNISFDADTEATEVREILFNSNGSKLYVSDKNAIFQYSLSVPFDISNVVYDNETLLLDPQDNNPAGMVFSPTGDKFYMVGFNGTRVYQYSTNI